MSAVQITPLKSTPTCLPPTILTASWKEKMGTNPGNVPPLGLPSLGSDSLLIRSPTTAGWKMQVRAVIREMQSKKLTDQNELESPSFRSIENEFILPFFSQPCFPYVIIVLTAVLILCWHVGGRKLEILFISSGHVFDLLWNWKAFSEINHLLSLHLFSHWLSYIVRTAIFHVEYEYTSIYPFQVH